MVPALPGTQRLQGEVFQWYKQKGRQTGEQTRRQWRVHLKKAEERVNISRKIIIVIVCKMVTYCTFSSPSFNLSTLLQVRFF